MRTIILAAGQGYKLGDFNKLLLKSPFTNETILDIYKEIFSDTKITIVVGYKAINIMNKYPQFDYIYNPKWHITKDSYSLSLALNEEPSYVIHSDFFISKNNIKSFKEHKGNCAVTLNSSDRSSTSLNCETNNKKIAKIYKGILKKSSDPELLGMYKITKKETLIEWKKKCLNNSNLLIGENFPIDNKKHHLSQISGDNFDIAIIKTPIDYINFINAKN